MWRLHIMYTLGPSCLTLKRHSLTKELRANAHTHAPHRQIRCIKTCVCTHTHTKKPLINYIWLTQADAGEFFLWCATIARANTSPRIGKVSSLELLRLSQRSNISSTRRDWRLPCVCMRTYTSIKAITRTQFRDAPFSIVTYGPLYLINGVVLALRDT